MKLLMLSKDNKVFDKEAAVRSRIIEYGKFFDEIHVVVMAKNTPFLYQEKISENIFIYSPQSNNPILILIKTLRIVFKLGRSMKKKSDIWITSQDPFETGFIAFIVSKLFKFKLQIQIHTDFLSKGFKKEKFINRPRVWIAKKILPYADSIRVVSNKIKESLLQTTNLKLKNTIIHVLPIFIDIEKIKSQSTTYDLHKKYPEFKKIILIASRLEKEKNIPLALSVFKKVLKEFPDAGLVIAGSGSEEKWIKNYSTYLCIEKNVRYEGWLSDIISSYKCADVLLVTSLYEGYGMSIIEALACGCSVISTDVGVAKESGAEIVNYDAGEIANKIIEVLSRRDKEMVNLPSISKEYYLNKFIEMFK